MQIQLCNITLYSIEQVRTVQTYLDLSEDLSIQLSELYGDFLDYHITVI